LDSEQGEVLCTSEFVGDRAHPAGRSGSKVLRRGRSRRSFGPPHGSRSRHSGIEGDRPVAVRLRTGGRRSPARPGPAI